MRTTKLLLTGLTGAVAAAVIGVAAALPAAADGTPSGASPSATPSSPAAGACAGAGRLTCIQQRAATAIADRQAALQLMTAALDASARITASDRSTLLGEIQSDESGLTALGQTIQSDTSAQQAWTDAQKIVTQYRVYVLEAPKVHLVIAGDSESSLEAQLSSVLPSIQAAITASGASASEKAAAQSAYSDCVSKLSAAQSASSGVSAAVIGLEPSGYPGNKSTLASARQSAGAAREDLGACRTDLAGIRKDLRP